MRWLGRAGGPVRQKRKPHGAISLSPSLVTSVGPPSGPSESAGCSGTGPQGEEPSDFWKEDEAAPYPEPSEGDPLVARGGSR